MTVSQEAHDALVKERDAARRVVERLVEWHDRWFDKPHHSVWDEALASLPAASPASGAKWEPKPTFTSIDDGIAHYRASSNPDVQRLAAALADAVQSLRWSDAIHLSRDDSGGTNARRILNRLNGLAANGGPWPPDEKALTSERSVELGATAAERAAHGVEAGGERPRRVRVKRGAIVGQDFKHFAWPANERDVDTVFEPAYFDDERVTLRAPGFGGLGAYGNGALYAMNTDIEPADEPRVEARGERPRRIRILKRSTSLYPADVTEGRVYDVKDWSVDVYGDWRPDIDADDGSRTTLIKTTWAPADEPRVEAGGERSFDVNAPVGVAGEVKPDGSQEVVLNDNGRAIYGERTRIVLKPADEPRVEARFKVGQRVRVTQSGAYSPSVIAPGMLGTVGPDILSHGCDVLLDARRELKDGTLFFEWCDIEPAPSAPSHDAKGEGDEYVPPVTSLPSCPRCESTDPAYRARVGNINDRYECVDKFHAAAGSSKGEGERLEPSSNQAGPSVGSTPAAQAGGVGGSDHKRVEGERGGEGAQIDPVEEALEVLEAIYRTTNPADIDLDRARAALLAAVDEAVRAETTRCEKIVEAEPECPDEPSAEMQEALDTMPMECVRAAVRATKMNIVGAIRASRATGGAKAGGG